MKITREDLTRIKSLWAEIEQINRNIEALRVVSDTVKGSSSEHPWTQHAIKIEGVESQMYGKLQKRLQGKLDSLKKELKTYDKKLEGIEDNNVRTIMLLKVTSGMNNSQIGELLGYSRQSIESFVNDYFNEKV